MKCCFVYPVRAHSEVEAKADAIGSRWAISLSVKTS